MQRTDGTYRNAAVLTHQGHVLVFAERTAPAASAPSLGYASWNPSPGGSGADVWTEFAPLTFPTELRPVGMRLLTFDFGSGGVPVSDAPFQVLSDGVHVYVFRQSAQNTLLVDRFVFDTQTNTLVSTWEVRYRRSGNPDVPEGPRDSFGSTDMIGEHFVEPTTELTMIDGLTDGWFSVVILPTQLSSVSRWQIFAYDAANGVLDSYSIARSSDGLFDLSDGLDASASPPSYPPNAQFSFTQAGVGTALGVQSAPSCLIHARQEEILDSDGQPVLFKTDLRLLLAIGCGANGTIVLDSAIGQDGRIAQVSGALVVPAVAVPGTALAFNGLQSLAAIPTLAAMVSTLTVEAWVQFTSSGVVVQRGAAESTPFTLELIDGVPTFTVWASGVAVACVQAGALAPSTWYHLAASYDGTDAIVYVNGLPFTATATASDSSAAGFPSGYQLGSAVGFVGQIDEVRLWATVRTQAQIAGAMLSSIASTDPDWPLLAGYFPLDEPSDATRLSVIPNLASTGAAANGLVSGAVWTASQAPVGPSMSPIAFDANGLDLGAGLLGFVQLASAPALFAASDGLVRLYFQQAGTNQLAAALYSGVTARANFVGSWSAVDSTNPSNSQQGTLRLVSKIAGAAMSAAAPAVQIAVDPTDASQCTVTLQSYTGMTEVWPGVPMALTDFVSVLSGGAAQLTTDPIAVSRQLLMYDYTQVDVTATLLQSEPAPGPGGGSGIFNVSADSVPTNAIAGVVLTTAAAPVVLDKVGLDCRWLPATPPAALSLTQSGSAQSVSILTSVDLTGYAGALDLPGDLCVEAWVYPTAFSSANLVFSFANPTDGASYALYLDESGCLNVLNGSLAAAGDQPLPLNTWSHVAANYQTDYGILLSGTRYLDAGKNASFDATEALTVEAWVRLDAAGLEQVVASRLEADGTGWVLAVGPDAIPVFVVTQQNKTGTSTSQVKGPTALAPGSWTYLAGVYDISARSEVALAFQGGGVATASKITMPSTQAFTVEAWVMLASPVDGYAYLPLVWGGSGGSKPAVSFLLAYLAQDSATFFGVCDAQGKSLMSLIGTGRDLLPDTWNHVAATFDGANGSLYVNGEVVAQATIASSAFAAITTLLLGAASSPVQYHLTGRLNEVRLWGVALSPDEIRDNMKGSLVGDEPGLVGYWPLQDGSGNVASDLCQGNDASIQGASFVRVQKGPFAQSLYVNGTLAGQTQVSRPIQATKASVRLGAGHSSSYLQGVLDDVLIWSKGRLAWQITDRYLAPQVYPEGDGLISAWFFLDGNGAIATDSKGDNAATIVDSSGALDVATLAAMWVPTFFKAGWSLYVNGVAVSSAPPSDSPPELAPQCSIGAGGTNAVFSGAIAEVRVWDAPRSAEKLLGTMNAPLFGDEHGLRGYWPLGAGSGSIVVDLSAAAEYGTVVGAATWTVQGAPVGSDVPAVLDVPGPAASAPQSISGAPGAVEYGELSSDSGSKVSGSLKRAYVFVDPSGALNLLTDFIVGDLVAEFVGQVQTHPTVVGYIEGAPPLPSENLTVDSPVTPYKYLAASAITLADAENTTLAYAASRDTGYDSSFDLKFGVAIGANVIMERVFRAGVHATFEHKLGWLSQSELATQKQQAIDKTIEVFGAWIDNPYDAALGPRLYLPNNKGYALVVSGTADMFALRMKGSGALVAYSLRPNPDVPDDVNVIMFALDPTYVKNGTLDGWVGFQADQSYPNLTPGSFGSFFKPTEAYALKQQVQREHKLLKAYYDQFDSGAVGRRQQGLYGGSSDPSTKNLGKLLKKSQPTEESAQALLTDDVNEALARRSLVNTYVWNSDGGLYAEQEQFATTFQESKGGSYEFVGKGGVYAALTQSTGLEFAADVLFGGHIRTQATKTKTDGSSFGISIKLPGEGFLNQRLPDDTTPPPPLGAYPVPYSAASCPGKVNQYRFMTFYLTPDSDNFEQLNAIVDQDWLNRQGVYAGTADPDAFALREALSNTNEVWRVLHRVTYVNRIATSDASSACESLAPDVLQPDANSIAANALLIASLVPQGAANPMQAISLALDTLLAELVKNSLWGSLLAANIAPVRATVMSYLEYNAAP